MNRPSILSELMGRSALSVPKNSATLERHRHQASPISFTAELLLSIKKAASIDLNLYFSPCENFHLNKPAEWLVCYPLSWKGLVLHLRPWGQSASKELFQLQTQMQITFIKASCPRHCYRFYLRDPLVILEAHSVRLLLSPS